MTVEAPAHALRDRHAGTSDAGGLPFRWRLSPGQRRLALSAHVVISVGLFGVYAAMLILAITGATSADPETASVAYRAMGILKGAVPPGAIGVVVTGVLLALGTSWGLLQHLWVVVKLVLTIAALPISILLVFPSVQQAIAASHAEPASPTLVTSVGLVMLMLGAATVIAVYKPWGLLTRGPRDVTPAADMYAGRSAQPTSSGDDLR